mgnify:CR=1 FL=1
MIAHMIDMAQIIHTSSNCACSDVSGPNTDCSSWDLGPANVNIPKQRIDIIKVFGKSGGHYVQMHDPFHSCVVSKDALSQFLCSIHGQDWTELE